MILSDKRLPWKEKAKIRWHYFEKYGEQKLDIISSTFEEVNPFKQIVLHEGIRLGKSALSSQKSLQKTLIGWTAQLKC